MGMDEAYLQKEGEEAIGFSSRSALAFPVASLSFPDLRGLGKSPRVFMKVWVALVAI